MIIDERAINAGGITIRKKNSQHKSMIELQRSMKEQIEGYTELAKLCLVVTDEKGSTILNIAFRPPRYMKGTFSVCFCDLHWELRVFLMGASIEHIEILLKTVELRLTKIENNDKLLYFCMLFAQMCVSYGF